MYCVTTGLFCYKSCSGRKKEVYEIIKLSRNIGEMIFLRVDS